MGKNEDGRQFRPGRRCWPGLIGLENVGNLAENGKKIEKRG